jgi:hypothetical protein
LSEVHTGLASGRWFEFSLSEQLANVGSEFDRAFRARRAGNTLRFENAFRRFLELINLTLDDPRWNGARKREIARLKENIVANLYGDSPNLDAIASLERYFYYFGVARGKMRDHLNAIDAA